MVSVSSMKHLTKLPASVTRNIDSIKKMGNVKIVSFNVFYENAVMAFIYYAVFCRQSAPTVKLFLSTMSAEIS